MRRRRRKKARERGHVFQHGRVWWMQLTVAGDRQRRKTTVPVTHPEGRELAEAALQDWKRKLDESPLIPNRLTFEHLRELVLTDYRLRGRRSVDRAERSFAQLANRFAGKWAADITTEAVDAYVAVRLRSVSGGTVRLELAALKRAFNLALRKKLVAPAFVPSFPTLADSTPREGFFEREDFERVVSHLPDQLSGIAWLAYYTGMRRGEILGLNWRNIDRTAKVIRLDKTKNGKRRVLAYGKMPELATIIERQHEARTTLARTGGALTQWVFHESGAPITPKALYDPWRAACAKAGVARLFHDLRRTAIRNLVRAGVPDVIAMAVSGHRTRAVFDRYNIVDESDIADAFASLSHSLSHKADERVP